MRRLVALLAAVDPEVRARLQRRPHACRATCPTSTSSGRPGCATTGCVDLTDADGEQRPGARCRSAATTWSRCAEGRLGVAAAWATGRLTVQAGPLDLLRLRALL